MSVRGSSWRPCQQLFGRLSIQNQLLYICYNGKKCCLIITMVCISAEYFLSMYRLVGCWLSSLRCVQVQQKSTVSSAQELLHYSVIYISYVLLAQNKNLRIRDINTIICHVCRFVTGWRRSVSGRFDIDISIDHVLWVNVWDSLMMDTFCSIVSLCRLAETNSYQNNSIIKLDQTESCELTSCFTITDGLVASLTGPQVSETTDRLLSREVKQ